MQHSRRPLQVLPIFQPQHALLNMIPKSAAEHGNQTVHIQVGYGGNYQQSMIHKPLICAISPTIAAYFRSRSPLSDSMTLERFHPDEFNVLYNWLYTGQAAVPVWLNTDRDSPQYLGLWERVWVMCEYLEIDQLKTLAWREIHEYRARNWGGRYDRGLRE